MSSTSIILFELLYKVICNHADQSLELRNIRGSTELRFEA